MFYSSKPISAKPPLSPVSFVDRSGSEEVGRGGLWEEEEEEKELVAEREGQRWRGGEEGGSSNVRKLED